IDASGKLTFTPSGAPGTAIVRVRLKDDGGTSVGGFDTSPVQTFAITILAPPHVVSSSIQKDDVVATGNLTYVVGFSAAMKAANPDASELTLLGIDRNVTYVPISFTYNAAVTTLTIQYAGLPEDRYSLTLLSGDGRFENAVGTDLDGESLSWPIPTNRS